MSAQERSGERDLTFNTWRRYPTMPHDFTVIDVDQLGYCPRCHEPLFLLEATRGDLRRKATYVIEALARTMQYPVPVLVVGYTVDTDAQRLLTADAVVKQDVAGVQTLAEIIGTAALIDWETRLRAAHQTHCRSQPSRRGVMTTEADSRQDVTA